MLNTPDRMKSLIAFILCWSLPFLCLGGPIQSHHAAVAKKRAAPGGGGSGTDYSPYLVKQDFEGTGYDNSESWTESSSPDEDYTGLVLEGSQSLQVESGEGGRKGYTASDAVTACFIIRFTSAPTDFNAFVFVEDAFTNPLAQIYTNGGKFVVQHGSSSDAGNLTLAANTTYYFRLEYSKGTGANGALNLYVGTTSASQTLDASTAAGTATDQAGSILLASPLATTLYDHVRVKAGAPGTVTDWPQ